DTTSGTESIVPGNKVLVTAGYAGGGTPGAIYVFLGALGDVNLGAENYSNTARWAKLGGVTDAVYKYIGSNATLNLGAQDYTDTSKWVKLDGQNGTFYKYIG